MKRTSLLFTALALASGLAWATPALPSVKIENQPQGGKCTLAVKTDVKSVLVYLDYSLKGESPARIAGLPPGAHALILRKDGYYDQEISLSLAPDTVTTVTAVMEMRTGWLSILVDQPGAVVVVDGTEYAQGVLALPMGERTVTVKAFGYLERSYTVMIPDRATVAMSVTLEQAPFQAAGLATRWDRFNPRNAGPRGTVAMGWRVTAPGTASTVIEAPDGRVVLAREDGPFTDWDQGFDWDGRDGSGLPLPDGRYRVVVTALPGPGVISSGEATVMETAIDIDSSMIFTPRGSWAGTPGAMHAPDAFSPPADAAGMSVGAFFGGSPPANPTGGAFAEFSLSFERLLDLGLGVEAGPDASSTAAWLAARLSLPAGFPLAAALDGRLSSSSAGNPSWVRLSLPVSLGDRFTNLSLSPSASARWEEGFSARAGLGLALNLAGYSWRVSLSGQATTAPLDGPLAVDWPLGAGAEFMFMPGRLPLAFRFFGSMDWEPGAAAPVRWRAGLSLWGGL